ncbi:MAG: PTS system mannose/fructose/sorbose family transporter subunit IID [Deltaproteobacteria bacterium]|nr:PTS system mannose/fructose/sorbose family transporter subunit IID [Deltaproteobacteria bacterium]
MDILGLNKFSLFKVLWNSFFIQSALSFEKMQGMGFALAITPALKKIYKDKDELVKAVKRHMEFFNTHPYMASVIIGSAIKIEEDIKEGMVPTETVSIFKKSLMGPYGAIGDMYYWGSIKPMAAVTGVMLAALSVGIWAGAAFLVIYNIPHIWMRFKGLFAGYSMGIDAAEYIKSLNMPDVSIKIRYWTVFLLGLFLALYGSKAWQIKLPVVDTNIINLMAIPVATVLFAWLIRRGVSVSVIVYSIFIINVIYWHIAPHIRN